MWIYYKFFLALQYVVYPLFEKLYIWCMWHISLDLQLVFNFAFAQILSIQDWDSRFRWFFFNAVLLIKLCKAYSWYLNTWEFVLWVTFHHSSFKLLTRIEKIMQRNFQVFDGFLLWIWPNLCCYHVYDVVNSFCLMQKWLNENKELMLSLNWVAEQEQGESFSLCLSLALSCGLLSLRAPSFGNHECPYNWWVLLCFLFLYPSFFLLLGPFFPQSP